MNTDWREEFNKAYIAAIWDRGSVVRTESTYYGWSDYHATIHIRTCELGEAGAPADDVWYEFVGTFDGDRTCHGVSMVASCACGEVRQRVVRWDAPVGDIITAVLEAR